MNGIPNDQCKQWHCNKNLLANDSISAMYAILYALLWLRFEQWQQKEKLIFLKRKTVFIFFFELKSPDKCAYKLVEVKIQWIFG